MKHRIAASPMTRSARKGCRGQVCLRHRRPVRRRAHSSALARLQHHAQDAVDAEPGVPEAGVGVDFTGHELRDRD
jgi:hypothetical protein